MFHTNTNVNTSGTVLNTGTGVFTTPLDGTWSISYNLYSLPNAGDANDMFLYKNGQTITESHHSTGHYAGYGWMWFTGGRNLFLSLVVGDTVELRLQGHAGDAARDIMICFEFVS